MDCPICKNESQLLMNIEGYLSGTFYDVFTCDVCKCHHMDLTQIDKKIYNEIYKNPQEVPWYDRYFDYFSNINKQEDPLKWLADNETTYLPIYTYLKWKTGLNVLEIGCGLGYLTYAINSSGNSCIGCDLSVTSIEKAKTNFWDLYFEWDVFEESDKMQGKKFDVIVATEFIEHIDDFDKFFDGCKKYLTDDGIILLTTPNKGFFKKDAIWLWDLPPVHTIWFDKETFEYIGKDKHFDITFFDYTQDSSQNRLLEKILFSIWNLRLSTQSIETLNTKNQSKKSWLHICIHVIMSIKPLNFLCNQILNLMYGYIDSYGTLGVFLHNKR